MTRNIHASVITELAKDDFNMVSLLRMGFQVGSPLADVMITDADFDVTYTTADSPQVIDTYTSSGHITDLQTVTEASDLKVGTLTITMSAVEQTYMNIFLTTDYIDVRVRYYRAVVDDAYAVIGQPLLMFDGRISGYKLSESGSKSTLSITCASHWANFDIISGRKTNPASQQGLFPSDLGMDYAAHTVYDIEWGKG